MHRWSSRTSHRAQRRARLPVRAVFRRRASGARVQRARGHAPVPFDLPAQMTAAQRLARNLIGASPAFLDQIERFNRYAKCDATVLILGETGTGKEIFARASTTSRRVRPVPGSPSIAARSRTTWSRASCSAMCGAPTRRRTRQRTGSSGRPRAARCSWTTSTACRCRRRRSCCASCRSASIAPVGSNAVRARRRAGHRRQQPRPAHAGRAGRVPPGPVFPAERAARWSCRPAGAARTTWPCWLTHFVRQFAARA